MIIFTLTNTVTDQVYAGLSQAGTEERLRQYKAALRLGIDAPLYRDMKLHGADNFVISEWSIANDREESRDMLEAALDEFNAISLQGTKLSLPTVKVVPTATKRAKKPTAKSTASAKAKATLAAKPKLATGRTGSSKKEKAIREAIANEKAERLAEKQQKIAAEADEMKAIMARLDQRTVATGRRR